MSDPTLFAESIEPAISVIIPTLNEERHIVQVLSALVHQTLAATLFEVIIVDNGSTDTTLEQVHGFCGALRITILSRTGCTISALRNAGAGRARAPVFAFLDADCIPPRQWLKTCLLHASETGLWGAHYALPQDATWVGRIWQAHQAREQAGEVAFLPGGNVLASGATFAGIGGFPEELQTAEDVEFSARAHRQGRAVTAIPELAVAHLGTPRTLGVFYRKNRWHGTHVMRMFLANLPSVRSLPVVVLSLYTFATFWAVVLAVPVSMLLHRALVLWVSLAMLTLPAVVLAALRSVPAGKLLDVPPLTLLYLTYLLSRASTVVRLSQVRRG